MKLNLIIGLILLYNVGFAQIKEINPTSVRLLDLSVEAETAFNENREACKKIWDKMSAGTKYDDLTDAEKDALSKVDETLVDYWDIIGDGCSWYCGGGPKEVTASSNLKSQGTNNYEPQNAHDLNYKNVWVEGVPGYGISEYLLYTFNGPSPRITEIIIVNGHVKSQLAWENNSRVKKLKVYINDEPYANFNLQDTRSAQTFEVNPIGYEDRQNLDAMKVEPDWTIKFEILEVYKGLKYDDVVISEIYYDGLDVHCFARGTKIQMANQTTKNIEDLMVGDSVAYMDFGTKFLKSAKIEKLEKVVHHGLVTYKFESGLEITATQDHPFKTKDKGWASLKPDNSKQYKGFEKIEKISIGNFFVTANGSEKLIAI